MQREPRGVRVWECSLSTRLGQAQIPGRGEATTTDKPSCNRVVLVISNTSAGIFTFGLTECRLDIINWNPTSLRWRCLSYTVLVSGLRLHRQPLILCFAKHAIQKPVTSHMMSKKASGVALHVVLCVDMEIYVDKCTIHWTVWLWWFLISAVTENFHVIGKGNRCVCDFGPFLRDLIQWRHCSTFDDVRWRMCSV